MYDLPLLLVAEPLAVRNELSINGFPLSWFATVEAHSGGESSVLGRKLSRYAVLHPYALRPTGNVLRAGLGAAAAASTVDLQVALMRFSPGQPRGTVYPLSELGRLRTTLNEGAAAQQLEMRFDWPGLPAWDWTEAPQIDDTPARRDSLGVAMQGVWDALYRMGSGNASADWLAGARSSMRDFLRASALGGRPAWALDRVVEVATRLQLPGDESPEDFMRRLERPSAGRDTRDDAPAPGRLPQRLPNGQWPPRVGLRYLSAFEGAKLHTLAQGRLARLTDAQGQSLIQFRSHYPDGPRGRADTVRLAVDPLFRLNARQQWELAALYPTSLASIVMTDDWPHQMLDMLPY
ncbi:hypothetical protein KAK06_21715 [Ideonella sp. 4Y11]|uniref:Uncharacterized protein n=1 Tax=Ideonella aquatica TaxID=2824119 RepID=A0A941BLM1_9BURK|nr:hypothetical protein [Ideonella aquatica]MBQ0961572.1 hypothetical protein [Ideonella aquatica]